MWTKNHTTQPGNPLRCRPCTLTTALKRPMEATLPRSRYLNGRLLWSLSRRLIVLAACRPPCIATSQTPGSLLREAMSPRANTSGWPGRVRSGSTSILPARSVVAPVASASRPAERGRLDTGGPDGGAALEAALLPLRRLRVDAEGVDTHDAQAHAQLDAHLLSSSGGTLESRSPKLASGSFPPSIRITRTSDGIDVPEVPRQAPLRQLADLPGQLDPGRPGADDGEGHEEPLLRRVGRASRRSRGRRRRGAGAPWRRRSSSCPGRSGRTRRGRSRTGRRLRPRSGCRRGSRCVFAGDGLGVHDAGARGRSR